MKVRILVNMDKIVSKPRWNLQIPDTSKKLFQFS